MRVDCEGCAGCCIDWRAVAPDAVDLDHERRGGLVPLDDTYNLVPLSSDEVRAFVRAGFGDAMTPRLFDAREGPSVSVDGHDIAAVGDRPAFFVGLRKSPKPVGPFGRDPAWLPSCVFLDPETLQCRIHGEDRYPDACGTYPADNLALDAETECERVESAFDGERLLDADPGDATPLLGTGALGATVFAHPDADRLSSRVDRIAAGNPTVEDRAEFLAVAAASRPGSLDIDTDRYETAREAVLDADSWVGRAITEWNRRADTDDPDPALGQDVEERLDAPETPGWD
jgi:Fe-S-cluster containining protein